jgi:hypothetical protein
VRSHAKASSVGPRGQSSSKVGVALPVAVLFALVGLAFFAIPASARVVHEVSVTLGTGTTGSGDGEVSLVANSGIAVNEETHDVYVADTGNHRIDQFDSAGNFIRAFGADVGGAGVNTCTSGCAVGTSGSAPGAFASPTFVAVDNSSSTSKGDVYVADAVGGIVSKFQGDGTLISSWGVGGQLNGHGSEEFGEIVGIAVDASGRLFVLRGGNPGLLFRFEQDGSFSAELATPRGSSPLGLAVDPGGNFFKVNGDPSVQKASPSGASIGQVTASNSTTGLAVDSSSGELFVDNGGMIDNYTFAPSGEVVGTGCNPDLGESCPPTGTFGDGELTSAGGLAVDSGSNIVYAADSGASEVVGFAAIELPSATTEGATGIDGDSAILHGTVNADSGPAANCQFQYTTEASFQAEGFSSATSVACSPVGPFTGSTPHAVSAEVTGLSSVTGYRFRVVATNVNGPTPGLPLAFKTLGQPTIEQLVEAVGTNDAILSAKINPHGAPTTYHIEYGTTTAYGQSTAESAPLGFAGDESVHPVSVHISGLTSGTAYHFRFVATNSVDTTEGLDTAFATYPTSSGFGSCPNEQFRTGFGALLSDCRAYEQATPVEKHGANVQGSINSLQASNAGDRITFYLGGGLPSEGGSASLSPYMASREGEGWSTDGLLPLTNPGPSASVLGWSEDLSTAAVVAPAPGEGGFAFYLRDSGTGSFQLGSLGEQSAIAAFASDTSHMLVEGYGALLPGASAGQNVYDLDHGNLTLVGRIPIGSAINCNDLTGPACVDSPEGAFAGPYEWLNSRPSEGGAARSYYTQNTISRDGSKVFFTTAGSSQLYVREDGSETTKISASQRSTPDPNGEKPAAFLDATPDGSTIFFASCEKLTDDSTAVSTSEHSCTEFDGSRDTQGRDLYAYDVDSGQLTDLTVDTHGDARGADVQGLLGTSTDGSYVYFVANGVLAPGALAGNCAIGSNGGDTCNLYVLHDGGIAFIATLASDNHGYQTWEPRLGNSVGDPKTSRVSPDGHTLLFGSAQNLTGYDTTPSGSSDCDGKCTELFRYTASDQNLDCVSCNPTGVPPTSHALLGTSRDFLHTRPVQTFLTRNLSADGNRVFFDTKDALISSDTNGIKDVYEWEAKGSGSCRSESQDGGCLYLVSSGTSPDPSYFADASANGDHAFFFTDQQLVPTDKDQLYDIYDAGVGDGLASQHELTPPTCSTTACQVNPAPPPDPSLASASFSGPGNARSRSARKCGKGQRKVRRGGKVRCQKTRHAKQHKRHSNRGGSK